LLTENLQLLADSPNGIMKLRELILELAVRGKLVPQDTSDEPASELLRRIADESTRLVAEGKAKKGNVKASAAAQGVGGFELPATWTWTIFDDLINPEYPVAYGVLVPGPDVADGVPFVRIADLDLVAPAQKPEKSISPEVDRQYERTRIRGGEILMGVVGSIGKLGIAPESWAGANIARAICRLVPSEHVSKGYIIWLLQSELMRKQFLGDTRTVAQPTLNVGLIRIASTPLPPLAEQHRIVAKVDELMALCDRLEAQRGDANRAHTQLVKALLDSLTQASDAADFATCWLRLAEHFNSLFTTEASIDTLKQVLLQLAVMGKLVPQDARDEPACDLLMRVAEEKQSLVAAGQIRKQKPFGDITEEETPYDLPITWAWTRLGSQVIESGAGWSPSCEARPRDGDEWGVLKVSAVSWGIYQPNENKALPSNLEARPDHEVAKGDFLVSRANTAELVARSVVVEETPSRLMLSDKIVRLKLTSLCARRYINIANSTPLARSYYSQVAGGTSSSMKNVSREQILNLPIALPPLAEQHRIVAKVDQLMLLCDTLKRQINVANEKKTVLLNAVMAQV
jgi:type I restriction enzyme S subunit